MKLKATKKEIRSSNNIILKIGYCNAQTLLSRLEPFAYSCGIYGWDCDYYNIDNIIISTGYRPIGQSINYDLVREYDNQAQKISSNYDLSYDEQLKKISKLLKEFIKEVIK